MVATSSDLCKIPLQTLQQTLTAPLLSSKQSVIPTGVHCSIHLQPRFQLELPRKWCLSAWVSDRPVDARPRRHHRDASGIPSGEEVDLVVGDLVGPVVL